MAIDLYKLTTDICDKYGIKPVRSKGQNFLINEEIYDCILASAELKPDDTVLEVGPGLGFLTAKLSAKVKRVIAVELDDKLAELLKTGLMAKNIKNVEVVNEDILEMANKIPNYKSQIINYKIVANLPYNITSIFLRKFLSETKIRPESMVLMLQKEVAERLTAKPGAMSLLAVSAQFYAEPEIIKTVGKENFWPVPEVDSAIVKLKIRSQKPKINEKEFFQLVKFGFSARRKMLKNNLAAGLKIGQIEAENRIKQAGFNPKIRAQELSVEGWLTLSASFHQYRIKAADW